VSPQFQATGKIHTIRVDGARLGGWDDFHSEFARAFGFPDFYGRNMDAWVDCMTRLDEPFSVFQIDQGDLVMLEVEHSDEFQREHPALSAALYECAAFVNGRRVEIGEPPILLLSSYLSPTLPAAGKGEEASRA